MDTASKMGAKFSKKNLHLTIFAAILAISFTAVVWWGMTSIAIISNIVHPQNSGSQIVKSRSVVHLTNEPVYPEISAVPATYEPSHYLEFNGKDSYGVIPGNQNLIAHHFSIVFWARGSGPAHSFDRPLEMLSWIRKGSGTYVPYGWAFDTGNVSQVGFDKLRFAVGSTAGHLFVTSFITVPIDSWTHIAGIFNGTNLKVYKNGFLVSIFPFTESFSYPITRLPIMLGAGLLPHTYWTGDLSDIQIYKRPLSQVEITSMIHGHDNSNGLVGRWRLNEGSGSSIFDSSGNGNNGIIHNAIWK